MDVLDLARGHGNPGQLAERRPWRAPRDIPDDLHQHSVTRTIRAWAQLVAGAAGCALLISACQPATEGTWVDLYGADIAQDFKNFEADAPMSDEQVAELADGKVTEAEVNTAFERYRSCLRAEGYELSGVHRNGPFISFGIPGPAVESGVDAVCYASEYVGVDAVWQVLENADAGDRRNFLSECVQQFDIDLTGASAPATMEEMELGIKEAGYSLDDCPTVP